MDVRLTAASTAPDLTRRPARSQLYFSSGSSFFRRRPSKPYLTYRRRFFDRPRVSASTPLRERSPSPVVRDPRDHTSRGFPDMRPTRTFGQVAVRYKTAK